MGNFVVLVVVLCGTKNGSSMASLEEPFEAPLFLRVLS